MARKNTVGDGAANPAIGPAISPSDIKIETGALPTMRAPVSASKQYDAVKQAILDMPPGSWFIVPGTPGRTGVRLMGVRAMLGAAHGLRPGPRLGQRRPSRRSAALARLRGFADQQPTAVGDFVPGHTHELGLVRSACPVLEACEDM